MLDKNKELLNKLSTPFYRIGNLFLFEPNNGITRNHFENMIKVYLSYLHKNNQISDYAVRCDVINNPLEVVKQNKLVCDVAIKPDAKSEFVYIPVVIEQSFD